MLEHKAQAWKSESRDLPYLCFWETKSQHSLRYKFRIRESNFTSVIIFTCKMGPVSVWGYG